jgi:hypothetical protein
MLEDLPFTMVVAFLCAEIKVDFKDTLGCLVDSASNHNQNI